MTKQFTITISDWVANELGIEYSKNKSEKFEEFLVKGIIANRENKIRTEMQNTPAQNVESGISTRISYIQMILQQGRGWV
jgi:hypothetical protein